MSFIQITDPHFLPGDTEFYGHSPRARLLEGVELINREHRDCQFVLATGDLTDGGEVEAYTSLKEVTQEFLMPVHLMLGNHDSRKVFLSVFRDSPVIEGGFVQFALDDGEVRILCLDSVGNDPKDHAGRLCETRLAWLDKELAVVPDDMKIILACHHPPFDTGIQSMDQWGLIDREALWEVFQRRKPDLFMFGHLHRPISGSWRGIPIHSQRSFHHQVYLGFQDRGPFVLTDEQADISVVRANDETIQIFGRSVGGEHRLYEADH